MFTPSQFQTMYLTVAYLWRYREGPHKAAFFPVKIVMEIQRTLSDGHLKWFQLPLLSFIAKDDLGVTAILSPFVKICSCFNGGRCTEQGVPSTIESIQNHIVDYNVVP